MPPIDYNATYQEDFAPVPLSFPKILRTKKERKANQKDLERIEWQKNRLCGLTTQELIDLDIHSDRKLNLPNLRNPIGPTLAKRKWETRETFKIYKRYESGVRKKLYPMNFNYPLPTVFTACTEALDEFTYLATHPATWENEIQSRRDKLLRSYPYTFGFMTGDLDPMTDQPDMGEGGTIHGKTRALFDKYTIADNVLRRMAVWVSMGDMEGLFRHNPQLLPDFEVLCQQFNMASTLVHELMHVIAFAWSAPSAMPAQLEQKYFLEGLPVGERGFEWQSSVLGGSSHSILSVTIREGGGYFGCQTEGWPNIQNFNKDSPELVLLRPPLSKYRTISYVKVYMLEQLQQEEFWESAVRQYGLRNVLEAHKPIKQSFKIRTVKDSQGNDVPSFLENRGWTETKDALTALAEELQRLTELTPVCISGSQYFYAKVTIVTRSKDEKRPLIWGRDFLSQTIARDEFWSTQHSDLMESVNDVMEIMSKGKNLKRVFPFLTHAVAAHEISVMSIVDLKDSASQIPSSFQTQRRNLLIWNRGTRVFLNELADLLDSRKSTAALLDDISRPLEICRMYLVNPTEDVDSFLEDGDEAQVLLQECFAQATSGEEEQMDLARDTLKYIISESRTTLFDRCCARILECGISSEPGTMTRITQMIRVNEDIRYLYKQAKRCSPEWASLTKKWFGLARNVRFGVALEPEDRPANRSQWLGDVYPVPDTSS
ncbi:hypothetical protein HYFRA_00007103 [Hymenoscyphus fraxineus]|uniref:Uncharacterized protein n=1 Tax=Hymenoscyphus fraxineus TaxID=746836 RepID=A0A9N9PU02_9HELO|nr:hypothetical protein HYFRA_00007103 [Hymenoscyphus fraxineus]